MKPLILVCLIALCQGIQAQDFFDKGLNSNLNKLEQIHEQYLKTRIRYVDVLALAEKTRILQLNAYYKDSTQDMASARDTLELHNNIMELKKTIVDIDQTLAEQEELIKLIKDLKNDGSIKPQPKPKKNPGIYFHSGPNIAEPPKKPGVAI